MKKQNTFKTEPVVRNNNCKNCIYYLLISAFVLCIFALAIIIGK